MTLTQLKKQVDGAYAYAAYFHQNPDSIPVTIQLNRDGDEGEAICTHEDVEVHYDNNCCATGCIISATLAVDIEEDKERHYMTILQPFIQKDNGLYDGGRYLSLGSGEQGSSFGL